MKTTYYTTKELDKILTRLRQEMALAVTKDEKKEIQESIQFFTKEYNYVS